MHMQTVMDRHEHMRTHNVVMVLWDKIIYLDSTLLNPFKSMSLLTHTHKIGRASCRERE